MTLSPQKLEIYGIPSIHLPNNYIHGFCLDRPLYPHVLLNLKWKFGSLKKKIRKSHWICPMSAYSMISYHSTMLHFCPSISQTHIFKKNSNSKVLSPTHSSATEDFVGYSVTVTVTVTHLRLPPCIVYTVLPSVKSSDFPWKV